MKIPSPSQSQSQRERRRRIRHSSRRGIPRHIQGRAFRSRRTKHRVSFLMIPLMPVHSNKSIPRQITYISCITETKLVVEIVLGDGEQEEEEKD